MRILGIDPGSVITGFGIIEEYKGNIRLVEYDALKMKPKNILTSRLKLIYDKCFEMINCFKPDEFAIETAFFGKNIQSTLKLGQARGVAIIAALNTGLEVAEYSPREIKKSVTGNGGASKMQVQTMVKNILAIKETPVFFDSTDALAVALCHYYRMQNCSEIQPPKGKRTSLRAGWTKYYEDNKEKIITRK